MEGSGAYQMGKTPIDAALGAVAQCVEMSGRVVSGGMRLIGSGCEVNRGYVCKRLFERLPSVDLAHDDLA
jgi:hypothetical protein